MILGVTGTQLGRTPEDVAAACVALAPRVTLVATGGCIGVDAQVALWFAHNRPEIVQRVYRPTEPRAHPSKRSDYPYGEPFDVVPIEVIAVEGDELVRNRRLVDDCDFLLALAAGPEVVRSGTWATIRYARRIYRPVVLA